ncbi:MAG: methyltransferase domain-containing protein [Clostridia bacterium]|nr:methyltransferase domain-containing protein [Clostridia bacterium]
MTENKPDYANWMPKGMVAAAAAGTGALLTADIAAHIVSKGNRTTAATTVCTALTLGTAACAVTTGYFYALRKVFDYNGKRKLSKQIIDGIADYVTLPDGGTGLDVGCGSGALTIACAKRNPNAEIIGVDHWGSEYRDFTKERCEQNAAAEGVSNVRFQKGDAVKLDFPDETFDLVTSNYVYHNITGKNKQQLLLETLRVLKKGGAFAIHDLMSKARYGDMDAFVSKLKAMGYEDVRLIDTSDGSFMSRKEAMLLGLGGSTLLVGKK